MKNVVIVGLVLVLAVGFVVVPGEIINRKFDREIVAAQASSDTYKKRWFTECKKSFNERQCHLIACMKEPSQIDEVKP
jgi:hypothetical protein